MNKTTKTYWRHLKTVLLAGSAASMASAGGAWAQTAPQAQDEPATRVDEIVVTASRFESSLQDVPFSIMAIGAEQLERQQITRAEDLIDRIPGAYFNPNTKTASFISIRGLLATEASPASDLAVAFFVDDVYASSLADININYFDLARVEVLRGPQGTTFGRNVVGGAIALVPRLPIFDEDYGLRITAGDRGRVETEGYLNGVLVPDQLAGRLTFSTRHSDGLVYNRTLDRRLDDDNMVSVRGQLLFTPSPDVDIRVAAEYTSDHGWGAPISYLGRDGYTPALTGPLSTDPRVVELDADTSYDRELYSLMGRVDWRLGLGTLTSITAFRGNDSSAGRDADATPFNIIGVRQDVRNRQFTQELRLASDPGERFSYIVGGFYLDADNESASHQDWNPLPGSILELAIGPGLKSNVQHQAVDIESRAIFGEVTYRLTPQFSVGLGGRYTEDKKSGVTTITGPMNPVVIDAPGPRVVPFGHSWDAFTSRVVVRYEPTDDLNFYATVSEGFKSGGFTFSVPSEVGLRTPFDPEEATNYEIGAKTWLFDRRLNLNATLFRQDTQDLQVRSFDAFGQSVVTNAGEARVQGLELESLIRPGGGFQFGLNYAYLDAKFRNYVVGGVDYSGQRLSHVPEHAVTFDARYTHDLANGGDVTAELSYIYSSEFAFSGAIPDDITGLSESSILNGSLNYRSADGRWGLSLWGKNLTDETVLANVADVTSFYANFPEFLGGQTAYLATYNRPRTFGVTLSFRR